MLNKTKFANVWAKEADKVRKDVLTKGWNKELQSFTQAYGNQNMDSSLLIMEEYGFIDGNDERYKQTVKAVKKELFHNGLMYRYHAPDDFGTPTSAFTLCTFWLVRAMYVTGEKEEARQLFDKLLTYSNHLGLFSEDLDFESKRQLGNFPQAYSHLAVINTALLFQDE
jgi:GH15 family glucan-1,4-alpha-glucosidase